MKNGFTLVEVMIVVAILGLSAALIIPAIIDIKKKKQLQNISEIEKNDIALKNCNFEKVAEFKGHDIYTFRFEQSYYSVAIPTTNSVYQLEKK